MSRRTVLIIALSAILLVGGGWWVGTHFERVPVTHYQPPGPEAIHDRYLALERFMSRMGRSIASTGDIRTLDTLKPGGVLILDRHHRALLTKARLKALFNWVGTGGYLIVIPEYSGEPDPVLSYLHIRWDDGTKGSCGCRKLPTLPSAGGAPASAPRAASSPLATATPLPASAPLARPALSTPAPAFGSTSRAASSPLGARSLAASSPVAASAPSAAEKEADANDEDDDEGDDEANAPSGPPPKTMSAYIPGSSRPLAIEMQYEGLKPGDIAPAWHVALDDNSDWLVHYRYGLGNVSVIVNLDQVVSNGSIASFDHAEFFWKLLQHYQPTGPVTLMTRLPVPDLFDWLVNTAWAASISAAVLIALWLWRVGPRFGGTEPDVPPSRRELREHLNAVGRFVWRSEGLGRWLEVARTSFRERLAIRHPAIAAMNPQDQADALARLTSLPRPAILSALAGAAGNASEFTAMLRTLKNLKHNL